MYHTVVLLFSVGFAGPFRTTCVKAQVGVFGFGLRFSKFKGFGVFGVSSYTPQPEPVPVWSFELECVVLTP